MCMLALWFFFFKQKTAYELLISDWSSDVCSSDLIAIATARKILDSKSARFTQPSVKGAEQKLRLPLYSATVDHRHGTNAYSAFSDAQLNSELAEFCTEYWSEIAGRRGVPNTPDGMSDQEIVGRKSVGEGKSVSGSVDLGGRR